MYESLSLIEWLSHASLLIRRVGPLRFLEPANHLAFLRRHLPTVERKCVNPKSDVWVGRRTLVSGGTANVLENSPNLRSFIAYPVSGSVGFDLPAMTTCLTRLYRHVDRVMLRSLFFKPGNSRWAVRSLLSAS